MSKVTKAGKHLEPMKVIEAIRWELPIAAQSEKGKIRIHLPT